jgi:predicted RNA-binding Zn-ribbon protein involved in translation (DUF1610 family)
VANETGKRYACQACGAEVIVTKGGGRGGQLLLGPHGPQAVATPRPAPSSVQGEPNLLQVGKRYQCQSCGTELLITKPSDGELACCQKPMELLQPKQTASAD